MNQLVIAMIGQDVENFISMNLGSIKNVADHIVFIDGGSKDKTTEILKDFCEGNKIKHTIIRSNYRRDYKGANGYQRNIYLEYIKKHFEGDICLVIDPDEVLGDNAEILKTDMKSLEGKEFVLSVKMRHTINDLAHEDFTVPIHFAPGRLFRIQSNLFYEETEHPIIKSSMPISTGFYDRVTIWHLAYSKEMFWMKKRYLEHLRKSNIHSPQFLEWWYNSHINGEYPRRQFNITELPKPIKDYFLIDDDYYYFRGRTNLEPKHFLDAYMWKEYFKPEIALDIGCGVGQRVFTLFSYGIDAFGCDISEYAIKNSPFKGILKDRLSIWDITQSNDFKGRIDLVICYDILEHIDEKDLDKALKNIYDIGKKDFVFSIPFVGDPNLENDPTHKIKWTKEQWTEKLKEHKFIITETPSNFLFKEQLIICQK